MVRIRVELYKGPVNPIFEYLPGYTDEDLDPNQFWAVVIPKPKQGTCMQTKEMLRF